MKGTGKILHGNIFCFLWQEEAWELLPCKQEMPRAQRATVIFCSAWLGVSVQPLSKTQPSLCTAAFPTANCLLWRNTHPLIVSQVICVWGKCIKKSRGKNSNAKDSNHYYYYSLFTIIRTNSLLKMSLHINFIHIWNNMTSNFCWECPTISPEDCALLRTRWSRIAPPCSHYLRGAAKLLKHTQLIVCSTELSLLGSGNRDTLIRAPFGSDRKDAVSCSLQTMYV